VQELRYRSKNSQLLAPVSIVFRLGNHVHATTISERNIDRGTTGL